MRLTGVITWRHVLSPTSVANVYKLLSRSSQRQAELRCHMDHRVVVTEGYRSLLQCYQESPVTASQTRLLALPAIPSSVRCSLATLPFDWIIPELQKFHAT